MSGPAPTLFWNHEAKGTRRPSSFLSRLDLIAEHIDEPGADFEDKPYMCCDVSPVSPFVNTPTSVDTLSAAGGSPMFGFETTGGEPPDSTPVRVSESDACQFSVRP
ncbi:MAG: hypothetical protein IPK53_20300 [bacterium]|nr:hypothetical protein [bacterium]